MRIHLLGYPTCDTLDKHNASIYVGPYLLDMLKMRLKRLGKKREVSYRIVIAQSTSRRDGRPVAEVGFYNPRTNETRLNEEAIADWLKKGAQPTDSVRSLLAKANLVEKAVRPIKPTVEAAATEAAA
jgi:small subunit ribosomal protein S16